MKAKIFALTLIAVINTEIARAQNPVGEFITSVTDQLIIPSLEDSFAAAKTLNASSETFCDDPNSTTILQVQSDWANAMQRWSSARLFKFGPMIGDNTDLKIHYLPIRKNQIKANLKTDLSSDVHLPVSARGLAAIEYLLFDNRTTSEEMIKLFAEHTQRCAYLMLLGQQLVSDNEKILSDWNSFFAAQFNGKDGKITQAEALGQLFRSMISYFEAVIKNQLGRPAGINAEQSSPYKSEAWRSGTSIDNMIAGVYTFGQLLDIKTGLVDLLENNNQSPVSDKLSKVTAELKKSLRNIESDLFIAVDESPQLVRAAYDNYVELTHLLKQAAKALNIQIGFNDQDGD